MAKIRWQWNMTILGIKSVIGMFTNDRFVSTCLALTHFVTYCLVFYLSFEMCKMAPTCSFE